jgi:hypothetical protein
MKTRHFLLEQKKGGLFNQYTVYRTCLELEGKGE